MSTICVASAPLSPLFVWGLFARLLAVVYLIAFASLSRQVVALAGAGGIQPIEPLLRKMRSDYPGPRRFPGWW